MNLRSVILLWLGYYSIFMQAHGLWFNTLVATSNNSWMRAEALDVGQKLYNKERCVEVVIAHTFFAEQLMGIALVNGDGVFVMLEQLFLCLNTPDDQALNNIENCWVWRQASELKTGDWLRSLACATGMVQIQAVESLNLVHPCKVIRLTTDSSHIFYITKSLLVAHNCN